MSEAVRDFEGALIRLLDEAITAENEACAKIAEEHAPAPSGMTDTREIHQTAICTRIAAAIRARGGETSC